MTKKESSEIFSTKAAFFRKSLIFSRKSSIFSRKCSIFSQNLYKFDLGFSGDFSVARLGFSIFLEWQHCQKQISVEGNGHCCHRPSSNWETNQSSTHSLRSS